MRFPKASISVVASIFLALSAGAQSIWTGTASDNWSNSVNWNGGAAPVSGDMLQLVFNADGTTTYTANNDIGPFTLNSLTFANTSSAPVIVGGNSLTFAGVNPAISTSTSGSSSITAPIIYAANTAITNSGAGTLALGAQTFADGVTFTNSGSGTLVLADAVAYTGTNVNINLANTGTGTLNIGNLTAGVSGNLNITAGAVKFAGSTAGDLFGDALILNLAAGTSFDFGSNAEGFGGISGAGNIIQGTAGLTFTAPGDRTYTGVISGTGGVTQNNANVLSIGGANTYSGNTQIQAGGTIRLLGANKLSPSSAVIIVSGQGTLDLNGFSQTIAGLSGAQLTTNMALGSSTLTINGSGTGVRTYNGTFSGTGNLVSGGTAIQNITGVNTYTGTTTVNGGTLRINGIGLQSSSAVSIGSGGTLDAIFPTDTTWSTLLSGSGNLTKTGAGTLTFATPVAASPAILTVNTGALVLDHSSNNDAKFVGTSALVLNSGTLSVLGNSLAATTETFTSTSLTGGSKVSLSTGISKNATINLGAITRRVGTSVNFAPVSNGTGVASITTTTANGSNGILGGYATFNGTDWAVTGTGAGPFTVAPLAAGSYTGNTWSANTHTDVGSSFTLASAASTGDVRFNAPAASTVTLVGTTNSVSGGGILVTPNVGANNSAIAAGSVSAPANQELFLNQFNTAGTLTVSSIISNTAGTPVTLTVASLGTGTTMTVPSTAGLFPGMIITATTNSPQNIPTTLNGHIVSVNSPTSITISFKTDVTGQAAPIAGTNVPVTFTPGTYVVKNGPGTVVLSGVNTFNGSLVLNEGTVSANVITNLGSNATGASSSVIFNGGTLRLTGAFSSTNRLQPYIFGPGGGTIEVVNAGQTHTKQGNSISGSGTFTKTGLGSMSIGSNGSAFNGQVIVNGGVLFFQSNQFQSAQGVTVNPGGQYQINDDAVNGNFNIVAGGVMSLNGLGPAGSTAPGAFALTDQSGTSATAGGPQTNFNSAVHLAGDASVGVYNGSSNVRASQLTFANPVTGPGNLLKIGNGTLVLSNAFNTYGNGAGMTAISNGTLRINLGNNRLPTGTTLQFGEVGSTNNGTFDLNGFNQTVSGLTTVGSASGHLIVNNSTAAVSTLTVNYNGATPETFAGTIGGSGNQTGINIVKSGTGALTLSGNNTYTGTTTVSGGNLRVFANTVARPYTIADGASLSVVNTDPVTPFSMSALTLGTATVSSLGFELTDAKPTNGVINVSDGNGLTANGKVNVALSSVLPLTVGQFPLIKYQGAIGGAGFGAFSTGTLTLPSRVLGSLVNNAGNSSIDLNITGVDFIKWTGTTNGNWNINSTQNWKLNSNSAPTTYLESPAPGDTVVFDETAAGTHTVSLTATITPSAVTVSGPADYTFAGPGKLAGPTGITKNEAGMLTILSDNSNTGATLVSGGTLQIGNGGTNGSLGSGSVTDNGTVIFNRSDDVAFAANLSGSGALVKNGAGTLALTGGFGLTGNTTINAGTLALSGGTYAGNISGAGALSKTGVGTLTLTGAAGHTGGTNISGGILEIGNGGTTGSLAGNVTFSAGTVLAFNRADDSSFSGNITGGGGLLQSGTGKTLLTGALNYGDPTVVSAGTLEFGSASDTVLNGKVSGTGTIIKSGAGLLSLFNANGNFTGPMIVNGGTVLLDDLGAGGDLNSKDLTINNGGKFIFGANGNADFLEGDAGVFLTINTGGEFELKQGEVWSATRLAGGTFRYTATAAIGSTMNAVNGAFTGYALESGTIVTTNTRTGVGTLTGNIFKTTPGTVNFNGRLTIAAASPISLIEGVLAFEPGNVPASGAGTISMGNSNTTGVFRMVGPGSATSSRPFNVEQGAIDIADVGGTLTLTGSLSGSGTLAKTGPGTLVITPNTNFNGLTTVSAGTLRANPGSAGGNFAVATGAKLAIANGSNPATVSLPAFSLLGANATVAFEYDSAANPTVPLLNISNTDGLLTNGGTHTAAVNKPQPVTVGQFTLIDYDGAPITSGFALGALPSRAAAAIIYNTANTSIDLNVTGVDTTLWNGNVSANWDAGTAVNIGGTQNFKLASNATSTNFVTTDRVTFDETAAGNYLVNLTTALQPGAITVNNETKNYTFQGPGSITGTTGLTKLGNGTLTITTDNNYTGPTTVSAGTLEIGSGGTTGSITSNLSIAAGATVSVNRSDNVTYGAILSGAGTVNKNGAGTLTLTAVSPFTGTVNVNQGTVLLDDLGAGGDLNATSIVVNNGASFIFGENGNADFPASTIVTINAGGVFDLKQGEDFGGVVLKGGTFQMTGGTRTAINANAAPAIGFIFESGTVTTNFTGAANGGQLGATAFLDKTTAGTVNINGAVTFAPGLSINVREGVLEMGTANFPVAGTTSVTIGDATTSGTLRVRDAGAASSVRPFAIGDGGGTLDIANAGGTITLTAPVTGATGTLTKTGAGTLALTAANLYNGPTVVSGGTLSVSGSIATSSGVSVNNAAGTFEAAAGQTVRSLTVTAGQARVAPGATKFALTVGDGTQAASQLSLTGGRLDLTTNGVAIDYASSDAAGEAAVMTSVRNLIIAGFGANKDWQGNGITSASAIADKSGKAIGYALASEVLPFSSGGSPTTNDTFLGSAVDKSTVVARYTLAGDATLDGVVDFNDLVKLAQNYNTTVSAVAQSWWNKGDFTYDGITDFNDLVKLAQNYNTALPTEPIPGASAAFESDLARAFANVPEPSCLGIAGVVLARLMGRRGQRRRAA